MLLSTPTWLLIDFPMNHSTLKKLILKFLKRLLFKFLFLNEAKQQFVANFLILQMPFSNKLIENGILQKFETSKREHIIVPVSLCFVLKFGGLPEYMMPQSTRGPRRSQCCVLKLVKLFFFISRGFDLPTLGAISRRICPQDHGAPLLVKLLA